MILISDKHGQLANRLFIFAHFLAFCIEYKVPIVNLAFSEYRSLFYSTNRNDFMGLPVRTELFGIDWIDNLLAKVLGPMIKVLAILRPKGPGYRVFRIQDSHDKKDKKFDLRNPSFRSSALERNVFVQGWLFRDELGFSAHKDTIRKLLRPEEKYANNVAALMAENRAEHDIVVGVHLRRGDYKHWLGGKYYFENATFTARMQEIQEWQASMGKKVIFFLSTNETLDLEDFVGFNVSMGSGHFVEDLYSLAACDYIIGPPSTFSMWAAYYGDTPLMHLKNKDQEFSTQNLMRY